MKLKYIIITMVTVILSIFLSIGLMIRGLVKKGEAELEAGSVAAEEELRVFYEGRSASDYKIDPEILGITLSASFGEVLRNPALQTATQIMYSEKESKPKIITVAELSKIYEIAKANMDDVASVQTFVNNPRTNYIITVAGNHQYLGFEISELELRTTYSPEAKDFVVDRFGASLKGDFDEILGKISGSLGELPHLRGSSTSEWQSIGKYFSTVKLHKTCQVEIESKAFNALMHYHQNNQQIALDVGHIKLDVQKSIREAKEKLKAAEKRMEEAQQKQKSEYPDTPGGNQ